MTHEERRARAPAFIASSWAKHEISRRGFLAGSVAVLTSGSALAQGRNGVASRLNAWLRIAADDTVTLTVSQSEMGQGISTTLPVVLADELGADWSRVRFESADFDPAYRHPQYKWMFTGNSESVSTFYPIMRTMGAAARQMLTSAAATRLGVEETTLRVDNGRIHHDPSGRSVSFGQVAAEAAKLPVPEALTLKSRGALKMIGKPQQRIDIPSKVDGSAVFGIDVKVPGMAIAAIRRAPSQGGVLLSYDAAAIKAKPDVIAVVEIPSGLAVVAAHYWQARRALDGALLQFGPGPLKDYSTRVQRQHYADLLGTAPFEVKKKTGDAEGVLAAAGIVREATFEIPAQAHATMEPMNCTAHVTDDRCELWIPAQGIEMIHTVAKQTTGLRDDQIVMHRTLVGGGFGRRLLADFARDAFIVSRAVGRPVKVIWSREEDMRYDAYRPPVTHQIRASLGSDGQPEAMTHRVVSPSHMLYILPRPESVTDWARPMMSPAAYDQMAVEGLVEPPYSLPNYKVEQYRVETPLSVSVWRTTGHGPNNFVLESFIDELAHAAQQDPLAYRLTLAAADRRALAVLKAVAQMSDWTSAPPVGRARGIALAKAFNGYIAQAVELSVSNKEIAVHDVWSAVDVGETLDPGIAASNIEGGVVWGLSGLRTEVTFANGEVQETNFDGFEPVHLWETPRIKTQFVESGAKPSGTGELGPVPTHAAVCNAIFAATGERIRALPISRSGYRFAPSGIAS
ncbi:molybdopterin cofactor-binding domain-containing protein [Bradyrhizobium sp. AS23.2]|uniref:xanthine dehydrogenase family protein molybdopterin-binding subunit n=1 Tax=Bradyrhizobium sp. AS23.2 TaxID=1680155 RepID=UPI0009FA3568|nr:molybdopterin cofactor-binding domain-containing protein [Bradyrhizobium sp. AS23.2]